MADKSFGVKELNLLNASGTPTITSPNNLNLNANTVAISTSVTIGHNITVSANAGISSLNVSGIATVVNFNATGISTIAQPADSNPMANWTITNNSSSAYRFTGPGQSGTEDNPNIYLVRGHRYIFRHNATGSHPIQIRFANGGAAYTDGVTYSDTGNNRTTDGNNLIFNVQHDAPAQLFYQCTSHGGMVGNIYVVGGPQVISGVVTATSFVGDGSNLTGLSGVSLANGSNNRVVTATGASGLNGEAGLTFDGDNLIFARQTSGDARAYIYGGEGGDARLLLGADEGDDHIDTYEFRSQASDNALVLYQFESGAYRNRMEFESGGNIGINRTNPSSLLHIQTTDTTTYNISTAQTNGILTLGANNSGAAGRCVGLQFNGTASNGEAFITLVAESSTEANLHFGMRSGGSRGDRLRISRGGDIGAPSGNNIYNASDERLKENMIELTDGLSKIEKLKPISFNWKDGWNKSLDGITQYGFGAQTTQVVDEKLVEPFGTGDVELNGETIENPLRVNEKYIIPLLVKAVQELSAKVAALEGS